MQQRHDHTSGQRRATQRVDEACLQAFSERGVGSNGFDAWHAIARSTLAAEDATEHAAQDLPAELAAGGAHHL
ncbi:MAG: hypothetical protein V4566_08385, partial [Pseudomonadota bacterium]